MLGSGERGDDGAGTHALTRDLPLRRGDAGEAEVGTEETAGGGAVHGNGDVGGTVGDEELRAGVSTRGGGVDAGGDGADEECATRGDDLERAGGVGEEDTEEEGDSEVGDGGRGEGVEGTGGAVGVTVGTGLGRGEGGGGGYYGALILLEAGDGVFAREGVDLVFWVRHNEEVEKELKIVGKVDDS